MAQILHALSIHYGQPPHYWLELDDVLTAFDYEVLTKAKAMEQTA